MAEYIPLEDAAKMLGVSVDELKDMRSRSEIFGVRDGSSWKFKADEIERVRDEMSGDVLDDDPGGSSILVSEQQVGASSSTLGSNLGIGGGESDLRLSDEGGSDLLGSDVTLVPDPASGSGVRLVSKNTPAPAEDDDEVLEVPSAGESSSSLLLSDLNLEGLSGTGSGVKGGSDLVLGSDDDSGIDLEGPAGASPGGGGAADLIRGDSNDDLQLDGGDDLVLDDDLALSGSSGLNLTSGSDSGLSLDEPLDLAGTGISGLNLASGSGSDVGIDKGKSAPAGSGAGLSGIDFGSGGEDFQLSPSGEMEFEDDSGSQVIELEDSSELAGGPAAAGLGGLDDLDDPNAVGFDDEGVVGFDADATPVAGAYSTAPETRFSALEVLAMLSSILLLALAGIFVTDTTRNLWAATEGAGANYNSTISDAVASLINGPS